MFTRISKKVKVAIAAIAAVLVLIGGGAGGYAFAYSDKALPGVTVAGQSVTGMSYDDVVASVRQRAVDTTISFDINDTTTDATLEHVGITVDAEKTADAVFAANAGFFSKIAALFSPHSVEPTVTLDDKVFSAFVKELAESTGTPVTNAEVSLSDDGVTFTSTEAAPGSLVNKADVKKAVMAQAAALESGTHELQARDVDPAVTTEAAKAAADKANSIAALNVTLRDGEDLYQAAATDIASWITITSDLDAADGAESAESAAAEAADAQSGARDDAADDKGGADEAEADEAEAVTPVELKVGLDLEKVTAWVKATAEKTNVEVVNGINNVNIEGKVLTVAKQGEPGWSANNVDALSKEIISALESGQDYAGDFTYEKVEPTYEERLVAEGAENLIYPAAPGEKWLDVNLSALNVTMYEGASVAGGPFLIVPGAPLTPTVTGTYQVYLKYDVQTMRGTNYDGTPYEVKNVPWINYFSGSYAIHGAPWFNVFGWSGPNGTHGCVNVSVPEAKIIYDWADIGTTVVSHY